MVEIVRIGRSHLAVHGAAGLSLRAVARDLGVVSSAVYRYVKNRDELLTLLVVDGYNALGDAVDRRIADADHDDPAAQFQALGRAVREWALAEPARYGLLFGSPVPGYQAPAEQTTGPGTRVIVRLAQLLNDAHRDGKLQEPVSDEVPVSLHGDFAAIREQMGFDAPDTVMARGVLVWSALFGAVNFEVFGQYGTTTFSDPAALFDSHLSMLATMVGLPLP